MTEKNAKDALLAEQFERLTEQLTLYTSYKAVFIRGMIYGVGTAIGATAIAAVVFAIFYRILQPLLEGIPLTSSVLDVLQ